METATFAAGCFWGVEAAFRKVRGVVSTEVGYTGGTTANPTYRDVCTGATGHAEAVRVVFDPSVVTYEQLLGIFWKVHNPTTKDRQGPDEGTQYRSAIFCHGDMQCAAAKASKERMNASGAFNGHIVTEIEHAGPFYRAEEYHQQYYEKHRDRGCSFW